ncbi:hypothetical protein GCM10007298_05000 [Williamsia phyllosphaerae]|uniref:Uncharacterized protein n=1 Tax=Williamsia phyllosphaerae TaxID=885042 RepID=A0ABQ1U942_9NOCA|nr:hypothetical protein GCM10007298_05000 [Williamsia phyllosphaerae]
MPLLDPADTVPVIAPVVGSGVPTTGVFGVGGAVEVIGTCTVTDDFEIQLRAVTVNESTVAVIGAVFDGV